MRLTRSNSINNFRFNNVNFVRKSFPPSADREHDELLSTEE